MASAKMPPVFGLGSKEGGELRSQLSKEMDGDGPESEEDEGGEYDDMEVEAAGNVRAAVKSGSDEDLAKALKEFIKICGE